MKFREVKFIGGPLDGAEGKVDADFPERASIPLCAHTEDEEGLQEHKTVPGAHLYLRVSKDSAQGQNGVYIHIGSTS